MQVDKFEGADFKYGNSFFKFQSKNTLTRQFGPKFHYPKSTQTRHFSNRKSEFFVLHENIYFVKFEGADFKYDNGFFKFQCKNTQLKEIFVPSLIFFFNMKLCVLLNSKDADFKYDMSYFAFSPEYQNKVLLIPNLKFFCFT